MRPWLAIALASLFLSAHRIFAPFIPDRRFTTFEMVMFFALCGFCCPGHARRPRLMPYIAAIHVLMDMTFAAMLLGVAYYEIPILVTGFRTHLSTRHESPQFADVRAGEILPNP